MSEQNAEHLTVKPSHFPKVVILTAAACWALAVVGAVLEAFVGH